MFFRICLLTVCLLALNACNQEPVATPQVAEIQAEISLDDAAPVTDLERIMANINELSSDAYGGREPMSEGEKLTLAFIEKQFRSMGLQPMFGDSYQQAVDLVSSTTDPATAQMTFHLSKADRLVTYGTEMVLQTRRVVPESRVENSDLVFVGYGVVAPEAKWNDYAGVDVKGKTVVMFVNDPGFITNDDTLFNGKAMTYYGRWTYKFEEAARQGAAAAILIHEEKPAAYGWNVVEGSWSGEQAIWCGRMPAHRGRNSKAGSS